MKLIKYSSVVVLATCALPFYACAKTETTCDELGGTAPGDSERVYPDCGPVGSGGTAGTAGTGGDGGTTAGSGGSAGGGGNGGASGSNTGGTAGEAGSTGAGGTAQTGGEGGSAGASGEGGSAGGGTTCDLTLSPSEDECVIDEDYGVFVSPTGDDDSGNGSRAKPFATIGEAISRAEAAGKRVYACANGERYRESVSLDDSASGLELFGGFSCDDWSYSTSAKSRVTSATPLALHVENVSGLRVEDFAFEAADADATTPGGSSIGALVANSTGVLFRRVRLDAGAGVDGANGTREDFTFPDRVDLDGNAATGVEGGNAKTCMCLGGAVTSGGGGGDAEAAGQGGGNGTPNFGSGKGGTPGSCLGTGTGGDGGSAPATTSAPGAPLTGNLSEGSWTPASGSSGPNGSPGQGGGGGASSATGGGGGGGCGGCGGAGGKGGEGGGGSIALAVFRSEVDLQNSELIAADAGDGGDGIAGQDGQMEGGAGGIQSPTACPGGAGGFGGKGAASGGGAGGISVGVLWTGESAPVIDGTTTTLLGMPGAKGIGGDPGINDGIDGVAENMLKAP
jgi:hypothetical protein